MCNFYQDLTKEIETKVLMYHRQMKSKTLRLSLETKSKTIFRFTEEGSKLNLTCPGGRMSDK